MKFLIVANSPDGLHRIARGCQREFPDAEVVAALRQEDFVQAIARGDFNLAIAEYRLSWGDGLWVFGTIRGRLPDVPVIMVTDSGSEEVAAAGVKVGLSDYVLRENLRRLPVAVRESLERAQLRERTRALQKTHGELELRVQERTFELLNAVELLKQEIAEHKRTEDALKKTVDRFNTLVGVARTINSTLDLDALLNHLVRRLVEVVPSADIAAIYLYDPQTQTLVPRACIGLDYEALRRIRWRPGEAVSGRVFQTGRSALLRTPEEIVAFRGDIRPENARLLSLTRGVSEMLSSVCVPLIIPAGEIVGTLTLASTHTAFIAEDLFLLEGVAAEAAVAVQNARLFEEVRAGREQMQAFSRMLVEAQEAERRRIARELHDEVGQVLTGLKLTLERGAGDGRARALVGELIEKVHRMSLDLRPSMLDDLGLLPALLWHFERYTAQTGVRVAFQQRGLEGRRFPQGVETGAYRIVQEALTNVARHAGVGEAEVRLWADEDALGIQVEDRGAGFDPEAALAVRASAGLSGMRERAGLLGGRLAVESTPGAGTCLRAELPLRREA